MKQALVSLLLFLALYQFGAAQTVPEGFNCQAVVRKNKAPVLFPNPVSKSLRIDMPGLQAKEASIINMDGRAIKSLTPEMIENEIDVSGLLSGTYMIHIITDEGTVVVLKFVKMAQ